MQSLSNHRFGAFEVLALLGVEIPEIVIGARIVGITLEQDLELGLSLLVVALIDVDDRQAGMSPLHDVFAVAESFENPLVDADGFVIATELGHGACQAQVDEELIGIPLGGLAKHAHGVVDPTEIAQKVAETELG